jgi:hypothetical protein
MRNYTRFEWRRCKITLVSSGEDAKLHSFRVEKMQNYTRFEWKRCKITPFRVEKMQNYTRFECRRSPRLFKGSNFEFKNGLIPEKQLFFVKMYLCRRQFLKLHSKRVEKMWNYTQNEWRRLTFQSRKYTQPGRSYYRQRSIYRFVKMKFSKNTDSNRGQSQYRPDGDVYLKNFTLVWSVVLRLVNSFRV